MTRGTKEYLSYYDGEPHALTALRAKEAERDLDRARVLPALREFKDRFWGEYGVFSPITRVYPDTALRYVIGYRLSFNFRWSATEDTGRFGITREVPVTATHVVSAYHTGRSLAQVTGSLDFSEPPSQRAIVVKSDLGIHIADRLKGVKSAEVSQMAKGAFLRETVRLEDKIVPPTNTLIDSFQDRQGVDFELTALLTRHGQSLTAAGLVPPQLDIRGKVRAAIFS